MNVNALVNMAKIGKTVSTVSTAASLVNPPMLVAKLAFNIGMSVVTHVASKKIVNCIENNKKN